MIVFKRKQIVTLSLILMIVVAGYLQYNYNESGISISSKDSGKLGEAVYVDNQKVDLSIKTDSKQSIEKQNDNRPSGVNNEAQKGNTSSKHANDFFVQAKIDREMVVEKNKEKLKEISDNPNATKEQKNSAYEKMIKSINNAEKEVKIETLIKEKGFEDAIVIFGEDGSVDIVVKAPSLSTVQTTQIADIVSRQAHVKISDIHIKNIY